jgi:hypothetical protein
MLDLTNLRPKGKKMSEDKRPVAYSDNDFVKWQEYRQSTDIKIAAMVESIAALQDEVMYWQREAMKNNGRY